MIIVCTPSEEARKPHVELVSIKEDALDSEVEVRVPAPPEDRWAASTLPVDFARERARHAETFLKSCPTQATYSVFIAEAYILDIENKIPSFEIYILVSNLLA